MQGAEGFRYVRMRALAAGETGLRVFTFESVRFTPTRDWVRVSEEAAAYLALLRARPNDAAAPLAFEVWTPPPVEPAADAAPAPTMNHDAEGADAPSGRLLPDHARALAKAAVSEGARAPLAQGLPPGDPAPAEAHEAREIAAGSPPSARASAPGEGGSPDAVAPAPATGGGGRHGSLGARARGG